MRIGNGVRGPSALALFVLVGVLIAVGGVGSTASASSTQSVELHYTGALQSFAVPSGICRVTIVAQGGAGAGTAAGLGAAITATVPIPDGDDLSVLVGGAGGSTAGGFGGGGAGQGGGGGGASVVVTSAGRPLVTAGGGGSGGGVVGQVGGNGGPANGVGSGSWDAHAGGTGGTGAGGTAGDAGGGGGSIEAGSPGGGAGSAEISGQVAEGGTGGTGTASVGGGGGGAGTLGLPGQRGGEGGSGTGLGGSTGGGSGDATGGNGGFGPAGGGGAGGVGFSGGGGGGGGGGYSGGGGGTGGHGMYSGGGGSSFVVAGATGIQSSTGTGDGDVTISYDPATSGCPAGLPGMPTGIAATAGVDSARISFTAPPDCGHPISSYTVLATDTDHPAQGGQIATADASPIRVDGLYPGDHYTFTATATNSVGPGPASDPSNAIATVVRPGPPTAAHATTAGTNGTATLSFAAPDEAGGNAVIEYLVTASDTTHSAGGGQQTVGTGSPLTVSGLVPGDSYTFTARAIAADAMGPASTPSNAVTPAVPTTPAPPSLAFKSASVARFTVAKRGRFPVRATGGSQIAYTEIGRLPKGVGLTSRGVLSGRPGAHSAGTYRFTIVAVSGKIGGTQAFTLTVVRGRKPSVEADTAEATSSQTNLSYNGALQSYVVPHGICAVTAVVQAGQGYNGGGGAVITARVPVPNGDDLSVLVGGAGTSSAGGFGGGGSGGGGGASVIATSAAEPLITAGGGGANGSVGPGGPANGAAPPQITNTSHQALGGAANGAGGDAAGTPDSGYAGGGGGGIGAGGRGFTSSSQGGGIDAQAGNGGAGDGTAVGGGGGGTARYQSFNGATGGGAGGVGAGLDGGGNGDAPGGNGGTHGGGGGGIGFAGGGGGGGGAGWGGGGGGSDWYPPAGGGSSHVVSGATGIQSAVGTGNGQVTISYDVAADLCPGSASAPTGVSATPGLDSASVTFSPPASDGGHTITSYSVTATDTTNPTHGHQTATGSRSPITVNGLYAGDSYTFTVTPANSAGDGLTSTPSTVISVDQAPGVATGVTATAAASAGTATVALTVPNDSGGSPIIGYLVTATDATTAANGGQAETGSATPVTVTGLAGGDSYTFTVRVINAAGVGPGSSPSNAVTPSAPPPPVAKPTLSFTTPAATTFRLHHRGRVRVRATGATRISYAEIGRLPTGVSFTTSGVLSGSPGRGTVGAHTFTVIAVSGTMVAIQGYNLTVER